MITNWYRLLLPIWDMLMTISDDGAGSDQISLNNQQLARDMNNRDREWMKGRAMTDEELNKLRKRINKSSMETNNNQPKNETWNGWQVDKSKPIPPKSQYIREGKISKQIWYWLRAIMTVGTFMGIVTAIIYSKTVALILAYVLAVIGVVVLVYAVKELLGVIFDDDM